MKAVSSVYNQCICFPTPSGVKEIRVNQKVARKCYLTSFTMATNAASQQLQKSGAQLAPDDDGKDDDPTLELDKQVQIDDSNLEHCVGIGVGIKGELKRGLIKFI